MSHVLALDESNAFVVYFDQSHRYITEHGNAKGSTLAAATMSLSSDFCVIRVSGWEDWWDETRHGSIKTYVSIVLFFLSAVLATPIARCVFFVVRKFTPKKWM